MSPEGEATKALESDAASLPTSQERSLAKLLMERAHDRLPLLAEAPRRRGATAKHGTHESSELQDSQDRNSQTVLGRGPG